MDEFKNLGHKQKPISAFINEFVQRAINKLEVNNYQQLGSVWLQNGLLKSLDEKNLTLSDGTVIYFNNDENANDTWDYFPATISKDENGAIIFEHFNRQKAIVNGTDGDDHYIFKYSTKIQVEPGKGNDIVEIKNSECIKVNFRDNDEHDIAILQDEDNKERPHLSLYEGCYKNSYNKVNITADGKSSVNNPCAGKTEFHFWGNVKNTK